MQNPFLIARFVVFALLANLNLLILAFAAWSASAALHSGLSVSVTTVFFLFNSCILFFGIALGMAELVIPGTKTARVLFECSWAASLSIFQMGTAISATVNGPAICRLTDEWELCTSSSLLIPVAWLSSLILFAHSLALFITAVVHVRVFPEIWTQSIYSIDWFKFRYNGFLDQKGCYILDHETDSWSRYVKDIEAGRNSSNDDDTIKAPWARTIRRGIDAPFKSNPPSAVTSPSTTATSFPKTAPCPVAPLRIQSRNIAGSRFIERFRESARLSRPESVSQMQTASRTRMEPFPPHVDDHDLPIPLPRLSKWMSADDIKGLDVHTINPTPTS